MKYIIVLGIAAFAVSVVLTALVRRWALKTGYVDQPGERKMQTQPVSLGGGIVVFWVTLAPIGIATLAGWWWNRHGAPDWLGETLKAHLPGIALRGPAVLILLISAAGLHVLGLIDDKIHLGPWSKLIVQLAVAGVLTTKGNVRFDFFIPVPWVTTMLSILWLVVIINAFNFLDNMDGLSAGVAVICSAVILTAAIAVEQVFVSGFLVLLIGSLLGFLVFNFAPAKIYLGDAGSLVVGLLVAVGTVRTTYYHPNSGSGGWYSALMPLVVLAVPLYDFTSVVIIRLLQGKSPFVGDQQHFSHRLVRRGMTVRQAVLTIYMATACTSLAGTFLNRLGSAGAILVFIQTLMIVLMIAILERPPKHE